MKLQLRIWSYVVAVLVGVIVTMFTIKGCQEGDLNPDVIVKKNTVIDTVYVPKPYPVIVESKAQVAPKPYKVKEIQHYSPPSNIHSGFSVKKVKKNYRDTIDVEPGMALFYDISVVGDLDSVKLGYKDTRPNVYIREKTTVVKYSSGLYGGISSSITKFDPSLELAYHRKRTMVGMSYKLNGDNLQDPTRFRVSVSRKLF